MRRSCALCALVLVAAFGALVASCVAPDGKPGTESPVPVPVPGPDAGPGPGPDASVVAGFEEVWARSFGHPFDTNAQQHAHDIAVSRDGQVLVVALDFIGGIKDMDLSEGPYYGLGKNDLLIAAYKADGSALLWSKHVGDSEEQAGPTVVIDASKNVFVAGGFESYLDFGDTFVVQSKGAMDAFVAKLDPTGKAVALYSFGDIGTEFVTDLAVDASGNIFIVGFTNGTIDFGGGEVVPTNSDDIFVAKLGPKGEHRWSKRIGKTGSYVMDEPTASVALTEDGRVVIAGYADEALKISNLELPDRGDKTAFVAMLDSEGNGQWGMTWGAPNSSHRLFGLAVSPSGAVAIAGQMQGTVTFGGDNFESGDDRDVFVAVFDAKGAHTWSRAFGSKGTQTAWDVAFDADENLFVAGDFSGAFEVLGEDAVLNSGVGDTATDAFVVQFDPTGKALRARGYGSTDWDFARSIAVDGAGNAYLAGFFRGAVDFAGKTLTSTGGEDAFVFGLSP
jgi:hypothetical protein